MITLFISCNPIEKKVISDVEIYYADKDLTAIVAVKCDNLTELLNTQKIVVKHSKLFEKLSNISFKNDNGDFDGDIRVKAILSYSNHTKDTICVSYFPAIMYLNNRKVEFNMELEEFLSTQIPLVERNDVE